MAVSSKKDKLIEEAQKLALRGQFDKAAKVYEQILALEPGAINLRQKLAELLIKSGRADDARKELETIGKHFSKNGFYLKSIAVYKQLQKLFPADISLSLTLAELNEKHGLAVNALSEYKLVFEYHEKAGNIPEALSILERMQNVDPQNIPIKVKLAEASVKYGKRDESHAIFLKTAVLLLERNDNATLAKISARVQQLFPEKPDFMLELLTEQISRGNAATAIDAIQGLLRGNPHNKRAWDLVVKAYQILDQPQRVKLAYQHYLKFFPSDPEAIYGNISSVTIEQNLAAALELLDKYETALISAGYLRQLEQIYQALDKLDPISIRVLEGLIRVATAANNENEVQSLTSKLLSLRSVSGNRSNDYAVEESPPNPFEDQPLSDLVPIVPIVPIVPCDSLFFIEPTTEPPPTPGFLTPESERPFAAVLEADSFDGETDTPSQPDEEEEIEIEIDLEIDLDSPFDSPDQDNNTSPHDNWLDSVGNLFDPISTAPRGVKFGNEMESSDAQSHFDLGQAFMEMGIYEEAINEFRQASQDPLRRAECLIMQCACLRKRGELEKAISILLALLQPGLSEEESCAVKYELASALEAAGKKEEAKTLLNEIYAINPGFRDISSRLDDATLSESLDFSDDDLKDF